MRGLLLCASATTLVFLADSFDYTSQKADGPKLNEFPPGVCNDRWRAVPRQADAEIFYMHCTGGLRAAEVSDDHWMVEPIFESGEARSKGFLSRDNLRQLIQIGGFSALGFQSGGWRDGQWHPSWRPLIPNEKNHFLGPADIWANIASNLFQVDRARELIDLKSADVSKLGSILDDRSAKERLAQAISLSLRAMDLAVEQIAEHYFEQLVNMMYKGDVEGQRVSNTMAQQLFAHVHSFFIQLGSARDYLAAFIADRLDMDTGRGRVDSMDKLRKALRNQHLGREPILDLLIRRNWLAPKEGASNTWELVGWLRQISKLRNQLVHGRPYGSVFAEKTGWVIPVRSDLRLYRYWRPIEIDGNSEHDLLDVIGFHYRTCAELFWGAAKLSGLDTAMITLSDKDIVSFKIERGPSGD